jgi:putative ABC transport system permease protein
MDALLKDLRYGFRRLLKSPGFSMVVILTLGLGIGANTAIFSVVNAVLLRPLPYRDPDNLVTINHFYPGLNLTASVSVPGFRDYHAQIKAFGGMAVEVPFGANLTGKGEPERLQGARASGELFTTLGVPALIGRALEPGEDQVGHEHVTVLSSGLWRRLYGARPDVLSQTLSLNGEPYQIVGVMPPDFRDPFGRAIDLWVPITFQPADFADNRRTNEFLSLIARVKPGVTIDQAARETTAFAEQLKKDYPNNYGPKWTLLTTTLNERARGNIKPTLFVLLGAVGFVLLIACANVANLLLARAAGRLREIALRTALGATRFQLARQLLTESVMLSLAGGGIGLLLAYWGVHSTALINPALLPQTGGIALDAAVLVFTLAVAIATGVLFGLVPAVQLSSADLHETLKEGGRQSSSARSGSVVRRGLVVAEVALALTLLTGAGLLLKSVSKLSDVNPGFDAHRLLTANLALPQSRYPTDTAQGAFFDQVLPRIAALPGVQSVGATTTLPFGGQWSTASFQVEGYTPPTGQPGPWGDVRLVSPDFFKTLQVPLKAGRFFTDADVRGAQRVTIVDDELVKRYFAHEDPIGKRIGFPPNWATIVGVVGHTMHEGLDAEARVQYYFPYKQNSRPFMALAIRTAGDPAALVGAVRAAVQSVDRDEPLAAVRTMDDLITQSMGSRRFAMLLLALFAGIALTLAAIGIYGVMSYSVAERAREMGVRMAIGAARADVLRLVLGQGMRLAVLGVVLGVGAAFGLTRFIQKQLFDVQPTDPATFGAVVAVLATVAIAATLIPALRATRVDPAIVLREE